MKSGAGLQTCARGRGGEHGFDRLDAGDGLLREWKTERDCAEQLTVDIDWASAHSLHDAGLGEWAATEPGENDALLWAEIFEDSEDFDLELFDLLPVKHGPADPVHAGADIFEWEEALSGSGLQAQQQRDNTA